MENKDHGRAPSGTALVNEADKSSSPSGLRSSRLKAVYFDQTVRALGEMIANEREWLEGIAKIGAEQCQSDVLFAYCSNTFHEAHKRALRLTTLADILTMMTRNIEPCDTDRSGEADETAQQAQPEARAGAGTASPQHYIPTPSAEGGD